VRAMEVCRGRRGMTPPTVTLGTDEDKGPAHIPSDVPPENNTDCAGPTVGLDKLNSRRICFLWLELNPGL
jgi:hypothetical protein